MPKETKFTLALMLLLAVAFGFVVWQRVSQQGDIIAALRNKAKKVVGKDAPDKKGQTAAKDGHGHDHHGHQHEPRKLPFDPRQTAQVANKPFNSKSHNHDHHGHNHPPENPFAQKPTRDLFAEPVTKNNGSKPNPFSPWSGSNTKKDNTVNAFPASQTRTKVEPKKPLTPFQQHFPGQTREEAPKPNPFAHGHKHAGHNHVQQTPAQNVPFNPFDTKPATNQQAGNAQLNSTKPAPNNLFGPFQPVQQTAQQTAQQPFDPFGNAPAPKQSPRQTTPAPAFGHSHRHKHTSTPNPFNAPTPTLKKPTKKAPVVVTHGPTRVYTVKPDESYWSISKTVYGSIRYFQALEQHNRSRISSAKKLRPGMKVLVPEEKFLLASYSKLIPGAKNSSGVSQSEQTAQGLYFTPSGHPMFRIGPEDTLSGIAHKHLGRTTRWVEIYNLNKDRVKTPDRLRIGTVLRLPADASRIALAPETSIRR